MSRDRRRVAVVEDEETIREGICTALRREQYDACAFDDGLAAWDAFERDLPDLAVLDIGLPRMDGLELCRRLRARSERLPIIFVTSREEEFDRVLGLEIGADDYLCKPFSMRELMARVKVLLRRAAYAEAEREPQDALLITGDLCVDPIKLLVTWKTVAVPLTVTEFLIVQALVRRPGAVLTRDQLMDAAYPDRTTVSDRTIDSHVKRIRRKFLAVDSGFARIEGVYGAGYRYAGDPA
ncbi:MAG TPA: response regulator transcription factor [Vicinamibacterales bacterium]|nr:response regulator transcription factor [Vicinamibacterales bacterium]